VAALPNKKPGPFPAPGATSLISFRQVARRDVFGKNNRQEQSSRIIVPNVCATVDEFRAELIANSESPPQESYLRQNRSERRSNRPLEFFGRIIQREQRDTKFLPRFRLNSGSRARHT